MKIAIIAPTPLRILGKEQTYGGIELIVHLGTEGLKKIGHEVYLFASGDSITSANLIPTVDKALGLGVSFEKEVEANRIAYEKAVAIKPDVIWDNTGALHIIKIKSQLPGFNYKLDTDIDTDRLVNTKNIPVIHTIHGPVEGHFPELYQKLSKAGHYFVTVSYDQEKRYRQYMGNNHLATIYNSIDLSWYEPSIKKENYLLWLGRYASSKGAHIALHAAHKAKMPIKLIGKLEEVHEVQYFNKFINPFLRKEDEVISDISNLNAINKGKYYKSAAYTLMTGLWNEPFGLVAIESMASGTPVIGPNKGALPEIIRDSGILINTNDLDINEDQLYITKDQKEYIRRVAEAIKNTSSIDSLIPRKRVENLFTKEIMADRYSHEFEKAIHLKSHKSPAIKKHIDSAFNQ